jgi:hypothetical protein
MRRTTDACSISATSRSRPSQRGHCTDLPSDVQREFQDIRYDFVSTPTPEPATLILIGGGLAGIALRARKRTQPRNDLRSIATG